MKRPYAQFIRYLYQLQRWFRIQFSNHEHTSDQEILTQEVPDEARSSYQAHAATHQGRPRYPAQIGLVGLVVIVTWWGWPAIDFGNPLTRLTGYSMQEMGVSHSLAVINPANVVRANPLQPGSTASSSPLRASPTSAGQPVFPVDVVTPTLAPRIQLLDPDNRSGASGEQVQPGTISLQPQVIIVTGNNSESDSQATTSEARSAPQRVESDPDSLVIEIDIPTSAADPVRAAPVAIEQQRIEAEAAAQQPILLVPTATATAIPPAHPLENIPAVEIIPAVGVNIPPGSDVPTPVPTATTPPTPIVSKSGPGRMWSSFTPRPAPASDHFWIESPFAASIANDAASPNYQFGSTAGDRYRPHHGVDISNPLGTPVQAGVAGRVVHAGSDQELHLGPYGNFYGQAVVIRLERRLPVAGGEMDVYVLYGHLNEVQAEVGQAVQPRDIIGTVGMTGIAIGPHLHVEVRLGANSYSHTVNPWLWLQPKPGHGAVAVRLLTADGRTWAGAKVSIARFVNGSAVWGRQIETYLDTERIGPDPAWGENGAMGDVPAGFYYLIGNIEGESIRAEFEVAEGETTFVEIRTSR